MIRSQTMPADRALESGHGLVDQVIEYIRKALESRGLQPGDQLPPERDLAHQLNVSRSTLRSGIGYLAAMGVLRIRHGVGTFVADGPPEIGKLSLDIIGALHGFQSWQMFEARNMLESDLAALAAERGQERDFAAMAEEVAMMYATCDDPSEYLIHDALFHRAIARASGNPILAALMETVVTALYDTRRESVGNAVDLKESAEAHREIYRAIRLRNAPHAKELMQQHLKRAEAAQLSEEAASASVSKQSGVSEKNQSASGKARELPIGSPPLPDA
jgi:GntR family transcriptional regulator, transcriptional repressor for pyruvate dehydrogenase complex